MKLLSWLGTYLTTDSVHIDTLDDIHYQDMFQYFRDEIQWEKYICFIFIHIVT